LMHLAYDGIIRIEDLSDSPTKRFMRKLVEASRRREWHLENQLEF
jgi:hypothetical protein